MKETVNASISGIAFILDRECYVALSDFLNKTHNSIPNQQEAERLVAEVEASIAEQILSAQSADKPVSMALLRPIIEQLGGQVTTTSYTENQDYTSPNPTPLTKRLFRNPKGAILGGVCSGMASYFRLDVVIFRILFLIPFFFGGISFIWRFNQFGIHETIGSSINGTAFLVYIILWIAIPKAKTPRQVLEMQGEPITVDNIVQHSYANMQPHNSTSSNIIVSILKAIAIIFTSSLFLAAAISVVLSLVGFSRSLNYSPYISELLRIINIHYIVAALWYTAIVMLPILMICTAIFGSIFNFMARRTTIGIMFIIWILLVIVAMVILAIHSNEISQLDFSNYHYHGNDFF